MPAYKNRPPLDPDTPVWRYLSLGAVIATVRDRKLRFTRVDKFEDPFEGVCAETNNGRPGRDLQRQLPDEGDVCLRRSSLPSRSNVTPATGTGGSLDENDAPAPCKVQVHARVLLGSRRRVRSVVASVLQGPGPARSRRRCADNTWQIGNVGGTARFVRQPRHVPALSRGASFYG